MVMTDKSCKLSIARWEGKVVENNAFSYSDLNPSFSHCCVYMTVRKRKNYEKDQKIKFSFLINCFSVS